MYCIEVHVTLLGLFGHPRSDSAPGESCPLAPPLYVPWTADRSCWKKRKTSAGECRATTPQNAEDEPLALEKQKSRDLSSVYIQNRTFGRNRTGTAGVQRFFENSHQDRNTPPHDPTMALLYFAVRLSISFVARSVKSGARCWCLLRNNENVWRWCRRQFPDQPTLDKNSTRSPRRPTSIVSLALRRCLGFYGPVDNRLHTIDTKREVYATTVASYKKNARALNKYSPWCLYGLFATVRSRQVSSKCMRKTCKAIKNHKI